MSGSLSFRIPQRRYVAIYPFHGIFLSHGRESVEEIAGTSLADFKPVGRGSSIAKRKSHLGSCVLLPSQRALWVEHGSWQAL